MISKDADNHVVQNAACDGLFEVAVKRQQSTVKPGQLVKVRINNAVKAAPLLELILHRLVCSEQGLGYKLALFSSGHDAYTLVSPSSL